MSKEHDQPPPRLLDDQNHGYRQIRLKILEGIARGEKDIAENNTFSNEAAKVKMEKWLN